jgi:hypothetical protein
MDHLHHGHSVPIGLDKGGYYHPLFLRGKRFLAQRIIRVKIKGTGSRKPAPADEPNFYEMSSLPDIATSTSASATKLSAFPSFMAHVNSDATAAQLAQPAGTPMTGSSQAIQRALLASALGNVVLLPTISLRNTQPASSLLLEVRKQEIASSLWLQRTLINSGALTGAGQSMLTKRSVVADVNRRPSS